MKFIRPKLNDLLPIVLAADFMVALFAMIAWESTDLDDLRSFLLGAYFFCIVCATVAEIQRVTIDAGKVCIMNAASAFRRRCFSVDEVGRIVFHDGLQGDLGEHLIIHLRPAPHRSWDSILLLALQSRGSGMLSDTPLFAAFMHAVAQAQPGVDIRKLPPYYRQLMPARGAAAIAVEAATKPAKRAAKSAAKRPRRSRKAVS